MKLALIIVGATAILAVALLTFKQTDSGYPEASRLSDDSAVFPNLPIEITAQQELGKSLARIETLYREQNKQIEALRQQLAALSSRVDKKRAQPKRESLSRAVQNQTNATVKHPTVAERFDNTSGYLASTATNGIDLEEVVYANLPTNTDAPMTDCNGSVCKVYTFSDDPEATNNDFVRNLSKNLTSDVNVYFVDEQGQQVIYVEAVE